MKTKSFKEILKETIQRNCTDDYDGMFLFFESSVIEAHNEYASQFQQEWIPVEVIREVVNKRMAEFISIHHTYEAKELESALNTILRLVPPQPYNLTPTNNEKRKKHINGIL